MKPLYELSAEFFELVQRAEAFVDDENTEAVELERLLNDIALERSIKICNIGRYIKSLYALSIGVDFELKKLREKKHRLDSTVKRLKDYLLVNIKHGEKFEDGAVKISSKMGPPALEVLAEERVPEQYIKRIPEIDTTKLKEDILGGAEYDFARVIQRLHVMVK